MLLLMVVVPSRRQPGSGKHCGDLLMRADTRFATPHDPGWDVSRPVVGVIRDEFAAVGKA
jgi:hypothetical protein